MGIVSFYYECKSGEYEVCEKHLIMAEETKDPQVVLDNSRHTKCWKCGNDLEFVEKR